MSSCCKLQVCKFVFINLNPRSRPRAASRALQIRFRRLKKSDGISSKPKLAQSQSKNSPKNWPKRKPFEQPSSKTTVNKNKNLLHHHLCNTCNKKRTKLKLKLSKLPIWRPKESRQVPQPWTLRCRHFGLLLCRSSTCRRPVARLTVSSISRKFSCSKNRFNTSTTIAAKLQWRLTRRWIQRRSKRRQPARRNVPRPTLWSRPLTSFRLSSETWPKSPSKTGAANVSFKLAPTRRWIDARTTAAARRRATRVTRRWRRQAWPGSTTAILNIDPSLDRSPEPRSMMSPRKSKILTCRKKNYCNFKIYKWQFYLLSMKRWNTFSYFSRF